MQTASSTPTIARHTSKTVTGRDPVIALAQRALKADERYGECCGLIDEVVAASEGRHITARDRAAEKSASRAYERARAAVLSTAPTSIKGVRAIFEFLKHDPYLNDPDEIETLLNNLLSCPALADEAPE